MEFARQVLQVGKTAQRTGLAIQTKPAFAGFKFGIAELMRESGCKDVPPERLYKVLCKII